MNSEYLETCSIEDLRVLLRAEQLRDPDGFKRKYGLLFVFFGIFEDAEADTDEAREVLEQGQRIFKALQPLMEDPDENR